MCSFLKGQILWRIVTSKILKPIQKKDEVEKKFTEQLDKWDGKNHLILTWFLNTYANIIKLGFCQFYTAKKVCDFMASRYSISDNIHQFQLYFRFHRMQQ